MLRELSGSRSAGERRVAVPTGNALHARRRHELVCIEPAAPPRLEVRTRAVADPGPGQLLVRVAATSVNPIDVKRAAGYGRRLLRLKGGASFPLVLGNDFAGTVQAVGAGTTPVETGQRVFGLLATGRDGGAHASHVVVPREQVAIAPEGIDVHALAILPYSFTTMWLAVRSTGLCPANAPGVRVLINGASGGLGRLAVQLLHAWGSQVTAICGAGARDECLALGARHAVVRGPAAIASLPLDFQVVLNFGAWEDELPLVSRIGIDALGHATTVHPLLASFDELGWLGGGAACWRQWKRVQSAIACRALKARYRWTVFRPDREALSALLAGLGERRFWLPIGILATLEDAGRAFAHVAARHAGRAVLLPGRYEA
jgi:D-arabinose 1-dehydrogenase-like Zn-dependent alcohol dehydrogenase